MNFYEWILKNYLGQKNPIGSLAKDLDGDTDFPRNDDKKEIEDYLYECGACGECMTAFEKAWNEYQAQKG